MIHNSVNILRAFKMVKIRYFKFKFMRMLAYVRKLTVLSLFCAYLIIMAKIYLYYKNMIPTFDRSLVQNRPILIDTEGYKLPDFDPFDPSISRYLVPPPSDVDCSEGKKPLTKGVSDLFLFNSPYPSCGIIMIPENVVDYGVEWESLTCCYKSIRRSVPRNSSFEKFQDSEEENPDETYYIESVCNLLESNITTIKESAVLVQCSSRNSVIYQNVHFFVQFNHSLKLRKGENLDSYTYKTENRLNVMIIGLDGVSRLNMIRYMPETYKTLQNIEAINFKGYNKNFDNTFPNLLAILTGYSSVDPQIEEMKKLGLGHYDYLPFIWNNFSNAGYTTVYGEDCSDFGTFAHLDRKGFKVPPTDYYLRPYFQASERNLGWSGDIAWFTACKICNGPTLNLQNILDYAVTVSKVFNNYKPYFSLLWSGSSTHDRIQLSRLADNPVADLIKQINSDHKWNKTVLFLISDHGMRYAGIRETFIGREEENLPISYMIVPVWFKEKYPLAYHNLVHNQLRLTTHFDVYETLNDILERNYENETYLKNDHKIKSTEYKLSLFRKIPNDRTCFNARIPIKYCSGVVATIIQKSEVVELAAETIVQSLNKELEIYTSCSQFTDYKIIKSYLIDFYEKNKENFTYYEIQLNTFPGGALLEAIVKIPGDKMNKKEASVVGTISRLNMYKGQSECIADTDLQRYCYCKS